MRMPQPWLSPQLLPPPVEPQQQQHEPPEYQAWGCQGLKGERMSPGVEHYPVLCHRLHHQDCCFRSPPLFHQMRWGEWNGALSPAIVEAHRRHHHPTIATVIRNSTGQEVTAAHLREMRATLAAFVQCALKDWRGNCIALGQCILSWREFTLIDDFLKL